MVNKNKISLLQLFTEVLIALAEYLDCLVQFQSCLDLGLKKKKKKGVDPSGIRFTYFIFFFYQNYLSCELHVAPKEFGFEMNFIDCYFQIICLVGIEFQCPISAERSTIGHQNLKMTQIRDLAVDQVCHRGA